MKNLSFVGFDKYAACSTGNIYSIRSGRFLVKTLQKNGYQTVCLSQDGIKRSFSVHRLVALAYLPVNDPSKTQVNHIDGDKTNNSLTNLEWVTAQENSDHAWEMNLKKSCVNSYRGLEDETAHKVCQLIADSWRNKDIATALDVDQGVVARIRQGDIYPDISKEYDFENTLPSRRKLSTEKLVKICEMLEQGDSYNKIRDTVNVSTATISKIKKKVTGTYISKSYKF